MGSKTSSRSGSLLPNGMDLTQVILLVLVGCLLCTMMSSNVEGFDLSPGGPHCTSRYFETAVDKCVPLNLNQDKADSHKFYCKNIAAPNGCDEAGLEGQSSTNIIEGSEDKDLFVALNGASPDDDVAAADMVCKVDSVDSCSELTKTTCQTPDNQNTCRWVDCNFNNTNPFASTYYNATDWYTIDDWKTCVTNNSTGDDNFLDQIDKVGVRAHVDVDSTFADIPAGYYAPGADGTTLVLKSGVTLPSNAWGVNRAEELNAQFGTAGDVTAGLQLLVGGVANEAIFPPSWKTTIDNKIRDCKGDGDNPTEGSVGWDSSGHNIKCINYDPTIREECYNVPVAEPYEGCGCGTLPEKKCEKGQVPSLAEQLMDPDCGYGEAGIDTAKAGAYRAVKTPLDFGGNLLVATGQGLKKLL
jgi:hypothetical protein